MKYMTPKIVIKQVWIYVVTIVIFLLIVAMLFGSMLFVDGKVEVETDELKLQNKMELLIIQIQNSRNLLSEKARFFSEANMIDEEQNSNYYGRSNFNESYGYNKEQELIANLSSYTNELNKLNDNIETICKTFEVGKNDNQLLLINNLKMYANMVTDKEKKAIGLILETNKVEEKNIPNEFDLNIIDKGNLELDESEKINKAREILLSSSYKSSINSFNDLLYEVHNNVNKEATKKISLAVADTIYAKNVQYFLLGLIILLIIMLLVGFHFLYNKPILEDANILKKNRSYIFLKPKGVEALNILVSALNEHTEKLNAAEKKLKSNVIFLNTLLNALPYPVFYKDIQGNYVGCNMECENFIGSSSDEIRGKNVYAVWPNNNKAVHNDFDLSLLEAGGIKKYEVEELDAKGELRNFIIIKATYSNSEGDMEGIVSTMIDITEYKILQNQLKLAKEQAEDANQAKSDFLAVMSHEIRTPINAVAGFGYLLLKTGLEQKQKEYAENIVNSTNNLMGIINNILDFSKIEAKKVELENITFDLYDILSNLANNSSFAIYNKGLRLYVSISSDIPQILIGDPLRLNQIILNLMNNAIKFTEKGEISVLIVLVKKQDKKLMLKFNVRDSGIGLMEEQRARLFKAFSQADMTTTRKYGGTGLGLAICKNLVEMMNGEIYVESNYGEGSNFIFTAEFEESLKPYIEVNENESFKSIKILLISANSELTNNIKSQLDQFHCYTNIADSLKQANSFVSKGELELSKLYDLIIFDLSMGKENIKQFMQNISESFADKLPKLIIVSPYFQKGIQDSYDDINKDAFLFYPIGQSNLYNQLVNLFGYVSINEYEDKLEKRDNKLKGLKVLLVEDNEINQRVAEDILKTVGIEVQIASNGREAVEMVQAESYDIVLMDLQMPVMDGFEASKEIRGIKEFETLPIIALTADALSDVIAKALEVGMNDYITKPIWPKALFKLLEHYSTKVTRADKVELLSKELEETLTIKDIEGIKKANIGLRISTSIKALEVKEGLYRIGGSEEAYLNILQKFYKDRIKFITNINEAIGKEDNSDAVRAAHTLKGVAGNIGAYDLQHCARLLEMAIKEGQTDKIENCFKETKEKLDIVIIDIAILLKENEDIFIINKEAKDCDLKENEILDLIKSLKTSLEEYDIKALKEVEALENALDEFNVKSHFSIMKDHIDSLEFDEALEVLNTIADDIKF
jgi:PAS domain S-box-containing protein